MEIQSQIKSLLNKYENSYVNQLLMCLPILQTQTSSSCNSYEKIISVLHKLCHTTRKEDQLDDFLKEVGVDKKQWTKLQSGDQKFTCIVKHLQKCVEESVRKVNSQVDNYAASSKKSSSCTLNKQNKNKDNFQWLKLNNKYPMCEPKLKAKLVQAISDSKNESNIRQRMQYPQHFAKVSLLDQSLIVDEYERLKIDYRWTDEDERLFLSNISNLKLKFNSTEFLKRCSRFRFISEHELQTLAAQEISRKLDQDNKIYLSREFLLDKYFSTTEFLTEQEMRFILKTSPMLSKCVDKTFIRNALKNIAHADISKLELKIAENIISRFDQVRKAVRQSRKVYKQNKNNTIKQRILQFEQKQEFEVAREIAREELKKHKIRRPTHTNNNQPAAQVKSFHFATKKSSLPLNHYHPPSGLFVKDCNEQCNDDLFNHYETNYIQKERAHNNHPKTPLNSLSMLQFYSGGLETKTPDIPSDAISTICQVIKAHYYEKSMREALDNYEPPNPAESTRRTQPSVNGNASTLNRQGSCLDLDKRPKTSCKLSTEESTQAVIKRKILQNKEKAKTIIYVNKLLLSAAENSYASFKALNTKFTPEQINTKDHRANTALYYASKNQNLQFIGHLLNLGADPSIAGEKQYTPLHFIFKTNNLNLITRCLCCPKTPNLNALNIDNKTPLAYATHDVLCKLYLQEGVVVVQNRKVEFDNNLLLTRERLDRLGEGNNLDMSRPNSRTKLY